MKRKKGNRKRPNYPSRASISNAGYGRSKLDFCLKIKFALPVQSRAAYAAHQPPYRLHLYEPVTMKSVIMLFSHFTAPSFGKPFMHRDRRLGHLQANVFAGAASGASGNIDGWPLQLPLLYLHRRQGDRPGRTDSLASRALDFVDADDTLVEIDILLLKCQILM